MPYYIHRTSDTLLIDQAAELPGAAWSLGPLEKMAEAEKLASHLAGYYSISNQYNTRAAADCAHEIAERINARQDPPADNRPYIHEICQRTGVHIESARRAWNRELHHTPKPRGGSRPGAGRKPPID